MSIARRIAVAAGALLAAACAHSRPEGPAASREHANEVPVQQIAGEQRTSIADAIAAALARTPGEAIEAVLEGEVEEGRREVFIEVMVLDARGDAYEVKVDPADGKILSADREDEADEAAELGAVLKRLPAGHLSLGEIVRRAGSASEGQMVTAGFASSREHGAVGVVQFLVGDELRRVTLDPTTAAVLAKRTIHEEDEDEADEQDEEHEGREER